MRQLTPAEIANLLGRAIQTQAQFYVARSSGGQPGQFLQVNGVQARIMEPVPPGQVILVRYGDEWRAYAPRNPAPVVRVVQDVRRRQVVVPVLRAGAAVLYSVVVGDVREFWVKTAAADVKVHEIPLEFTYTPTTSFGSTVGSTVSGSLTLSGDSSGIDIGFMSVPYGTISLFTQTTATYISGSGSGTARPVTTAAQSSVDMTQTTDSASATDTISNVSVNSGCFPIGLSMIKGNPSSTIVFSGTVTYTISAITSAVVDNPFEAWISASGGLIYVIIKSGLKVGGCQIDDSPREEFVNLVLGDLPTLAIHEYENGDEVETRPSNWRIESEDFLKVADQPSTADNCVNDFLSSSVDALENNNLYRIDLGQIIDGQTLQTRLQTSSNTVTANLSTRPATSDGTACILGTETITPIKVPSPGRGTIEGITYLPP